MSDYDTAADYDAQYSALYEPEIRTLTALARAQGGAVLDLCCGTGIVTIPLADAGLDIVGVDNSEDMLAQARAKAAGRRNPAFVLRDVLEFDTAQRFGLTLMTGNTFQCFLSEQAVRELFARVYALLEPGGVLIFDTRLPEGYDLTLDDDFKLWSDYTDAAGKHVRWLVKQAAYDAEHGVLHYEMKDVYNDGSERPGRETLKFTPLARLLELAAASGFSVAGQYGNWDLEPLESGAASGVLELRKS